MDFEVWAPAASSLAVRVNGEEHALARDEDGFWRGEAPARHGDDYLFVVDGVERPDPASRWQPDGVRGPSRVLDTAQFDLEPVRPALDELVLYELHVGTFTQEGTFDAAIRHLGALAELGVTAVEVMPVATFPGTRGWGYDGLYTSAPHEAYGGPEAFARFVDAAHDEGLGVVLDVVYNHVGPGNEALRAFGPYFTDRHETFWGDALDYSQRGVREWAIQNAELWVRDYGVDGLRLDAVHAVFDDSPRHVLAELAERVRAIEPRTLVTSEMEPGDLRPIEEWGHDAQWADELHHELHVLLTGEREGYYADYGSVEGLAEQLRRKPAERLIVCSQNHDQVGNRAVGDRPAADELRLRAAVLLFAPQTPLLFMGEEYGERAPVPVLHRPHRPGDRRGDARGPAREFATFALLRRGRARPAGTFETFERSKLDRSQPRRGAARVLPRAARPAARAAARDRGGGRRLAPACASRARRAASPTSTRRPSRCGVEASGPASRSRSARRGTGRARTSRSSPRTRSASSSASSTTTTTRRRIDAHASAPRSTGTATCRASARAQRYGYRVHGPYDAGARPALQPGEAADRSRTRRRSRGRSTTTRANTLPYVPDGERRGRPASSTTSDDAAAIPKSRRRRPGFDWEDDSLLRTPWHETVIYETHVKGFTKLHPDVREDLRGTYAGLASDAAIEHFKSLGVTAVELLPVHHIADESFLLERGLTNYWGYSSIGFLAPHALYAATGTRGEQVREFKGMVKALHRGGNRGDPRRRLQPHRRGQPPRPDARRSRASTTRATTG